MIKLGTNTINNIMLGDTEIKKAYLGGLIVYEKSSPVPELQTDIIISDTFFVGESLSVTDPGTWSNGPILEYQYRWVVDGLQTGDTGSSRLNVIADDGLIAYCQVRARNAGGWSEWEGSNQRIILDLSLWLDASEPSSIISSGGSVSQWNDKSGKANNFPQSLGSAQPTTGIRSLNGRNVISFDGNDNLIAPADLYTVPNSDNTYLLVCAVNNTAFSFVFGGTLSGSNAFSFRYQGGSSSVVLAVNGVGSQVSFGSPAGTAENIFCVTRSGANLQAYRNDGAQMSSSNAASTLVDSLRLGSTGTASSPLTGMVAEFQIARREWTVNEKNQVLNRLSQKWGIPCVPLT